MNDTLNIIENRVSLRKYDKRDIDDDTLNQILHSAMRAPTAGNMMMYSVIVIRDQKTKEILSRTCDNQPFIATAPVLLLFIADMEKWHRYFHMSKVKEFEEKRNGEYSSPSMPDLMLSISDALIAAQTAVIAAESLGIGSCYIGDILENYETHRELLDLPKYAFPISLLTLGYYEEEYKRNRRDRFDEKFVVFNEKYRKISDEEIKEMFNEKEKLFKENNSYGAENFGQMFYARKNGSEFFEEMKRSIREMLKNWKY
ncbi:MAG: nitroreductase family protein [Bacillota bacterium]|nr:nitroreductase family protein [Bacillota bacterium]